MLVLSSRIGSTVGGFQGGEGSADVDRFGPATARFRETFVTAVARRDQG